VRTNGEITVVSDGNSSTLAIRALWLKPHFRATIGHLWSVSVVVGYNS
jgi:hypothetical protein